jgi:uncharacterized protein (TIGR02145 family)
VRTKKSLYAAVISLVGINLLILGVSCNKGNPVDTNPNISTEGTITDIDGNVYNTIKIGNQVWTVENLRVTKYNDGSAVPYDTSNATWKNSTTPKFCYYGNTINADTIKKYGALYNWYVVNSTNLHKISPAGWHVPTDAEWDTLQNYLIANGYNYDGTTTENKIAKSMATKTDWTKSTNAGVIGNDLSTNNRSGFSALPGGCRSTSGIFTYQCTNCFWWSAAESSMLSCSRVLAFDFSNLSRSSVNPSCGFSVRLVKD